MFYMNINKPLTQEVTMARIWISVDGGITYNVKDGVRINGDIPEVEVGDNYYVPIANGSIIQRLGLGKLTPQMIVQRPEIWAHMGTNEGGRVILSDAEYMSRLQDIRDGRTAKLRAACPGIEELRAAYDDVARYHEQMERMMADEGNDGARPPRPIKGDVDALRAKYPAAASYLRAESWSYADHYAKSGAGRRAMVRIEAGDNHAQVMADMEREWSAHCNAHIWD